MVPNVVKKYVIWHADVVNTGKTIRDGAKSTNLYPHLALSWIFIKFAA